MKKILLATLASVMLAGCSVIGFNSDSDNLRVPVTYATIKVIERDNSIGADQVSTTVDRIRSAVNLNVEVSGDDLKDKILAEINFDSLDAADRYLLMTVLEEIEISFEREIELGNMTENDIIVRINVLLDYVEQAAMLSK